MTHVRVVLVGLVGLMVASCGTSDSRVDPADLQIRDLLGIDPAVAVRWDAGQRASARRVLQDALDEAPVTSTPRERTLISAPGDDPEASTVANLSALDAELAGRGEEPWVAVAVGPGAETEHVTVRALVAPAGVALDGPPLVAIALARSAQWTQGARAGWSDLPTRDEAHGVGGVLALRLGAPDGVELRPAPRAPFVAAYVVEARILLVNPILYAALEPVGARAPAPVPVATTAATQAPGQTTPGGHEKGNPYSFYGSLEECAAAERLRCEACMPAGTCTPETRDASDGNTECTMLAADAGRGYYELCANLAIAIATVADCTTSSASACPQAVSAGNQLGALHDNDDFVDQTACRSALDQCLAQLYGSPSDNYPPPPADGGNAPPTPPPARDTSIDCGSCNSSYDCNFSPQCDSCDSSCGSDDSDSCDPSCNDNCDSSGEDNSGSCDSCNSDSSSSGSCDSCNNSSSSGCSSSSDTGSCSNDKCSAAGAVMPKVGAHARPVWTAAVAVGWAVLPLVVIGALRRRARKKPKQDEQNGGER